MGVTRIELPEDQLNNLIQLSQEKKKSVSELVSIAIEQLFAPNGKESVEDVLADIRSAKGIWADRSDIGDTDEYVRKLRKGTAERLRRLGVGND